MRWLGLAFCTLFLTGTLMAQTPMKKAPIISTTIDFLDYAFYDQEGSSEYYELEVWEKRLQELASCGIKKVYLRVNACGATLWPSKVSPRYGANGRVHYNYKEQGMRLARTLDRWDPLAETIRLGHKHNLEVWCWDSIWDDSAHGMDRIQYAEDVAKHGSYPLMDDWHLSHPGNWSRRDPRLDPPLLPVANLRETPISRIVFTSEVTDTRPCRIQRRNLTIYVSEDGKNYRPYDKEFQAVSELTAGGHPQLVLSGLDIRSPFIKFYQDGKYDVEKFNMVFSHAMDNGCHLYDVNGREIAATWGQRIDREETPADAPVKFGRFVRFAWDAGFYQLGVYAGAISDVDCIRWLVGIPELLISAARAHKVDRFRELAAYPFDGYLYNIRSHSLGFAGENPTCYGFNPELVAEFKRRTGKDVLKEEYDREAYNHMRSEGIDRFLAECKTLVNGRPLYMTIGIPQEGKITTGINRPDRWLKLFGVRWHIDTWLKQGSVDGVTLLGQGAFPTDLVGKTVNGKPLKISVFREMAFPPEGKSYNFEADLRSLVKNKGIDEIELYESLVLKEERRRIISEVLKEIQ